MRSKKEGAYDFVSALLVLVVCILAVYCLTVMNVDTNKALDSQNHISSLMRSYLVKMETGGSLSSGDVDKLIDDLELYGMTEIHLYGNFDSGITRTAIVANYGPAGYGEPVSLRIVGVLTVESMEEDPGGFFALSRGFRELKVDISQKGISVR
ncbi:MAG: hypothetical protein J6J42_03950 [Lachnospiraceae bacterium]|nr:hypothetical protein [Lachnospiraceae bacterium]